MRMFALFTAVLLMLAGASTTWAVDPQTDAADAAIDYIQTQKNADGGFIGFGDQSSPGVTLDAAFALIAAGIDPSNVQVDGNSPLDYLESQATEYAMDPGSAAKLAYGVRAAGGDPTTFAGIDLAVLMADGYDNTTGKYGIDLFDHAFYLFALIAMGDPAPSGAVEYLRDAQLDDGGWEFDVDFASDTNTTAMVVQALIAAGVASDDSMIVDAIEYLAAAQDAGGAFAFLADTDPDAQSTAMVIQALIAAGEDLDEWAIDGVTPMDALLTFQNSETGAFQFAGEDSPFSTYQVVPGLLLAPFPALETLPDGAPAPATDTEEAPVATATPALPEALPDTGAAQRQDVTPWWAVAGLLAGAATAGAGAIAMRRR